MYPLFHLYPDTHNPIERDRRLSRRPASRLEILQRSREADRLHWMAVADREAVARSRERRAPALIDGVRQSISRMLIGAGHRIDPHLA